MRGQTIAGRYTVERAVGKGGMGTVWLCRDELLGRQVAVKQVGNLPGETASDVNRALREARSSAALHHPHVVTIFDAVEDDGGNWLVMEYVPSRTLAEILQQEGAMSPERTARIGLQVAEGLAAAHARGTMHRDVKPSNILVTDDGHVKISDFGISRTHGDPRLTRSGVVMGTPAYFAPEIARGEEPGLPADVWALGATLYTAVEGRAPYPEQDNALALLATIASQRAPLPRQAGALTDTIIAMMDRDPATRWSMDEAVQALGRLGGESELAADPTPTTVLPTSAPEPTPESTPVPVPVPTPTQERPRPSQDEDERRRVGWLLPVAAVVVLALVVLGVVLLTGDDEAPTAAEQDAGPPATSSSAPAGTGSEEPVPEETGSEEPVVPAEPETEPEVTETEVPEATGSVEEFGERYYSLLPADTESAYELLSPSYGTTYEEYDGFWSTVSALEIRGVAEVDDTTVDVDITYTDQDGVSEDETRRLFLEPSGDDFVIVDDTAV